jgi:hypothetical protein
MSTPANYRGWNVNDDGVAYHPGMYTANERHASAVSPWTQSLPEVKVDRGRRGILALQAWDRRGPLRGVGSKWSRAPHRIAAFQGEKS